MHSPMAVADSVGWRALIIPKNPTEFWAMALAVLAALGLLSVVLLKKDIKNRTTREAAQCTIDRCIEMRDEIIPLFLEFLAELTAQNIGTFITDPSRISFEQTEETKKINDAIAWMKTIDQKTINKTVPLLNQL